MTKRLKVHYYKNVWGHANHGRCNVYAAHLSEDKKLVTCGACLTLIATDERKEKDRKDRNDGKDIKN